MIWFRGAIVALIIGVTVLALSQTPFAPAAAAPQTPTPQSARVQLPTLAPQVIFSRVWREPQATPAPAPAETRLQVEVVDYAFAPGQLVIHPGQSVTWLNDGNDGHEVTGGGPGGEWRSGPLTPQERYARIFALAGTYDYECTIHPEMRGRILVQP